MAPPTDRPPALAFQAIEKHYGRGPERVCALRGADLTIDGPGFFAIMGPSGSGKSTLLHIAAGIERPSGGRVQVAGEELTTMSEARLTRLRRRRVGLVFQQYNLVPTLSARANIELPALLDGRPRRWRRRRAESLLEQVGLAHRARHRPEALSGGEQQRVAFARALVLEPALILADEPTGNLDTAASEKLWAMLAELGGQAALTVLMVTHEAAAAAHCTASWQCRDGRLTEEAARAGDPRAHA